MSLNTWGKTVQVSSWGHPSGNAHSKAKINWDFMSNRMPKNAFFRSNIVTHAESMGIVPIRVYALGKNKV